MSDLNWTSDQWVLKLPYTTNKQGRWFLSTSEKLIDWAKSMYNEMKRVETTKFYGIPYMLIQPRLENMKEIKVALINGQNPVVVSSFTRKYGRKFAEFDDICKFASYAWKRLADACPEAIIDGLVRIDVMSYRGRLVVNEFESLEADFNVADRYDKSEREIVNFLTSYWGNKLNRLINMRMERLHRDTAESEDQNSTAESEDQNSNDESQDCDSMSCHSSL